MKSKPQLGDRVREIVSGYEGVVSGYVEYLWGCHQVLVGRADKDGKPESEWFDIGRIEVVEQNFLAPVSPATPHAGADKPAPAR
jgi:hypothetical protein